MVGTLTLIVFFGLLAASARKWIPQHILPLQSVMVLGSVAFLLLSLAAGLPVTRGAMFSVTTLHPLTATLAGFILAGVVEAAGGFAAAARLLRKAEKSRWLGVPGAVFLLVNLPNIFAMPCGRVWAAALMPLALMLGRSISQATGNRALAPALVVGFILNAAASCGPSPLGGIGMMGEGMAGYLPKVFANHMQWAILISTVLAMVLSAGKYHVEVLPETIVPTDSRPLPESAWFACLAFFLGMGAIFIVEPPIPLQASLLLLTVVIMLVGKVSVQSMVAGIAFHPVTAMVAGFMMAGSLVVSGGFDVFSESLMRLAEFLPFGYVLVGLALVYIPLMFPMPCGRILSTSLLPGVLLFGQQVSVATGYSLAVPVLLVPFLLACAASCGPSPLGGIGGIGEGNLRLRAGTMVMPQQLALIPGIALSGVSVALFGVGSAVAGPYQSALILVTSLACAMACSRLFGQSPWHPGGLLAGALVGCGILVW